MASSMNEPGNCIRCGKHADLGWARCCLPCWESIPPIDNDTHDDWCRTACPHTAATRATQIIADLLDRAERAEAYADHLRQAWEQLTNAILVSEKTKACHENTDNTA